eukprot:Seg1978.1 transcript_id=Seg1978.1/GoldUCD/mRNA.D3Y31 product="Sphingomyelin phosphodiesterase 4" protein_id=Seg1978.1/GoldUCD/D3Y31
MMLQTDRSKSFIHKHSSVQQSPNPYSPVQRTIPSCDIKSYITKAQNATDAKVKFEILDEIINEFPANSELANFFTELVAEIFGYGEYAGWRLSSLDGKSHSDDILFKRVYNFLHPYGSIFKLIDKLESENAVFDIPSTFLQRYLAGASHSLTTLHQQRSGLVTGSQALSSPKLNALEYYLFMFFNYVSQPKARKEQIDWNKYSDVVYVSLFEEYLAFFLPLDTSPSTQSTPQSNPIPSSGNSFFSWHGSSQRPMTLTPTSSYHSQTASIHSLHSVNIGMKTIIPNNALGGMRRSTWKSETFVQILSDLWLTNNEEMTAVRTANLQEYQLPSVDQTLLIRIFVKHMHHFLNCGRSPENENTANYPSATAEGQKEEFKRAILPSIIQKKLYLFLKNCFSHWPLDPSFKMVLETWLSYIQPWRYCGKNTENPNTPSLTNIGDWQFFIDDNLLFYTMLFRMFIARVARLDLQSLKDIQMIQRVTKVFSQQDFTDLIKEAENSMLSSSNPSSLHRISATRLTPSYNAFRSSHKGLELEDTGFRHESIFDQHYVHQMEELAQRIFNEGESLRQENADRQTKEVNKGMMGKIKTFFGTGFDDEEISHDSKLEELLDAICNQLADIFGFSPPTSPKLTGQFDSVDGGQRPKPFVSDKYYEDGRLLPEHIVENDGSITLTEKGRQQIMQKLRYFDIKGAAPFDLEPVRSYEIHALVRWMYQLSTRLNDKYKEPLTKIYNREDFIGKTLRTLSPRVIEHDGKAVRLPSTSSLGVLQPKISLRFLASYYTIYYIGWLLLIAKLFGLGFIEFSLLSLLVLVVFLLQNIVSCPVKKD